MLKTTVLYNWKNTLLKTKRRLLKMYTLIIFKYTEKEINT